MSKFICCSLKENQIKQLANPGIPDEVVIDIFKALSHPLRLKILRLLTVEQEICTCDLTDVFNEAQPAVSKQLSKLEKNGLLEKRKLTFEGVTGRWHAYRLAENKKELVCHILEPFTSKVTVASSCNCDDNQQAESD